MRHDPQCDLFEEHSHLNRCICRYLRQGGRSVGVLPEVDVPDGYVPPDASLPVGPEETR